MVSQHNPLAAQPTCNSTHLQHNPLAAQPTCSSSIGLLADSIQCGQVTQFSTPNRRPPPAPLHHLLPPAPPPPSSCTLRRQSLASTRAYHIHRQINLQSHEGVWRQGCAILSGDVLIERLCSLYNPRLAVFLTDVPGTSNHKAIIRAIFEPEPEPFTEP